MSLSISSLQKIIILQSKQPCKKPVSSELLFAADPRPEPRKRGNPDGAWSLLSRTEAQDHLLLLQSLFLLSLTCNLQQRRKIRFSSKNSIKTVTHPGNGAKNLFGRINCIEKGFRVNR